MFSVRNPTDVLNQTTPEAQCADANTLYARLQCSPTMNPSRFDSIGLVSVHLFLASVCSILGECGR